MKSPTKIIAGMAPMAKNCALARPNCAPEAPMPMTSGAPMAVAQNAMPQIHAGSERPA